MQVKLEILRKGDSVLAVWDSHVAVKKESGEVEIFQYYLDEEGFPSLAEGTVLAIYGTAACQQKLKARQSDSARFEETGLCQEIMCCG